MRVHVFGHYDSRGGTIAVATNDKERAYALYVERFFGADPAALETADEDYLGAAELVGADDFASGMDLEERGAVTIEASPIAGVEQNRNGLVNVPPDLPEWLDGAILVYNPGMQSAGIWGDDAFDFILIRDERKD